MPDKGRPNILLVMADQLNPSFLGAYGSAFAVTPTLDELAENGTVFEHFYCNSPLCAPSRSSMVSGRLVSNVGAYDNGSELPAAVPTFMHHLRRAGYHTALSGKMHFVGPDQLHGFTDRLTTDIYPSNFGWSADWSLGLDHGEDQGGVATFGVVPWSSQLDYDYETHTRALEKIRRLATAESADPFLLCVSYTHPHDPFVITQEYWDRYEDVEIPPPAVPRQRTDEMHPFNRWVQLRHGLHREGPDDEQVKGIRHSYAAMVSYVDDQVAELLAELRRFSLLDDTIVIVTADHGEMMGERGMWYKRTYFEDAIRIPFIVSGARWVQQGRRVEQPASLVDLFPTLLDLAEVSDAEEIKPTLDGRSLTPILGGRVLPEKPVISEYCAEGVLEPALVIRSGRYKYVVIPEHSPVLYDLESDPHELVDLARAEEVAAVRAAMHELVPEKWLDGSLTTHIRADQRRRRWVREAMRTSDVSWDFQPFSDASKMYRRDIR
jgi:choline-sulfatase